MTFHCKIAIFAFNKKHFEMNKILYGTLVIAFALNTCGISAQKLKSGIFNLANYTLHDGGAIKKSVNESFQGLAIYKEYMIGLYNGGTASVYKLHPDGTFTRLNTFDLGSKSKFNHSNVANFGVERYQKGDILPLLYVSQTKTDKEKNLTDACFVERILPEGKAELVQTITLDNHDKYYGWAVQWAVDKKKKRLIGFGNTIDNTNPKNRFRIMVFKLPKLKDGANIVLQEKDIIENYLIQDYDASFPNVQIGQGGVVVGNSLIMPTGVGNEQFPSMIYSWNLKNHQMTNAINMQREVPYEFEDCDFFQNNLYIQCNNGNEGRMRIMSWK